MMRKRCFFLVYLFSGALIIGSLSGCVQKKTFVRPEEPLLSGAKEVAAGTSGESMGQDDSNQNGPDQDASGDLNGSGAGSVDDLMKVIGSVVAWDDATLMLVQITTEIGEFEKDAGTVSGKAFLVVLQFIDDTKLDSNRVSQLVMEEGFLLLNDTPPYMHVDQGVEIGDDGNVYSMGTINLLYDLPADTRMEDLKVTLEGVQSSPEFPGQEQSSEAASAEEADSGNGGQDAADPASLEGIEVTEGRLSKPESGQLAYTPSGADGFFAVNGTLKAQTSIGINVDPPGILDYDADLIVSSTCTVTAKIEAYKDGALLASYEEKGLELPEGEVTITGCIKTGESTVCSGTYLIRFYLNGILVLENEAAV